MPRRPGKKKIDAEAPREGDAPPPLNPLRTGMPAPDSITEVREYKKGARVYRVIKTTEQDAYDKDAPPPSKKKRKL